MHYLIPFVLLVFSQCALLQNPAQVEILARNSMDLGVKKAHLSAKQIETIRTILTDIKPVLYAALSQDPDTIANVATTFLQQYDESVSALVNTVLQIGLVEVQKLLKDKDLQQAREIIDATLKGGLAGLP